MVYDVVISGGSVAGCTAAIGFGRAGLRVAVLERQRRPDAYKAMCGHFLLAGTTEMLQRTGLWDELVRAGGVASRTAVWNGRRWIGPVDAGPPAMSLRRERLDPLLRRLAGATPGVDLLLGRAVTGVARHGARVTGVETLDGYGRPVTIAGRLVVGADGHRAPLATMAGVDARPAPNQRFLYWAYYEDVPVPLSPGGMPVTRIWRHGPDVAVAVPTDGELTMLGVFATKASLPAFEADRAGALEAFLRRLPEGPDLDGTTRVSKVIGTSDYPFARRHPAPLPGLALAGDAACVSDPVPATGCGWAFRSADWLVTATAPALLDGAGPAGVDEALESYAATWRLVERYDRLARRDALGLPPTRIQAALVRAAEVDPDIAGRLGAFGGRAVPPSHLLNPATVRRALALAAPDPAPNPRQAVGAAAP